MTSRPGEHVVLVGGPQDALAARQEGLQVRDTLLLLLPGGRVLTAFLCRRPLGSGMTVAENVLRYGAGGLWIDGCRVVTGDDLNGGAYSAGGRAAPMTGDGRTGASLGMFEPGRGAGEYKQPTGRWPTNLVLVHGPGCVQCGSKVVKGITGGSVRGATAFGLLNDDSWVPKPVDKHYYISEDGTETVAAWECQEDCPVRMMDEQSGDRVSGHLRAEVQRAAFGQNGVYSKASGTGLGRTYEANAGGASRFYPQFQSLTEALAWLARLIGGPL